MKKPGKHKNEAARLKQLDDFRILDTTAEAAFDDLVKIAAHVFDVPIALVSLVDEKRQWFKARHGLDAAETPREVSFCGHVVEGECTLIVPNSDEDERFADNPLVTGAPHVKFYVGAPLFTPAGPMGSLCVIDHQARQVTPEQIAVLEALANQVVRQMELRQQLLKSEQELETERERLRTTQNDHRVMLNLAKIFSDQTTEWQQKLEAMLIYGTEVLDLELGIVSQIEGQKYVVRNASLESLQPGTEFELGDTYCAHTIATNKAIAFDKASEELNGHPCYEKFQLESYIGCPLMVGNKRYGTINFTSADVRSRKFGDIDFAVVNLLAEWVAHILYRQEQDERRVKVQVEERLSMSDEFQLFSQSLEMIAICDLHGAFLHSNPAWHANSGHHEDELKTKSILDIISEEDREFARSELQALKEVSQTRRFESRLLTKENSTVWIQWSITSDHKKSVNYVIARDITDRKRVERMKDEFVSTVSHELRTPLTSIRGSLGLIVGGALGDVPKKIQGLLTIACKNTDRLVRLINEMLDLDKIESGKIKLNLEECDLATIVQNSLEENSSYANQHGVTYRNTTPEVSSANVHVDPDRIRQVIDNLLSNAAKYAENSGEVDVAIRDMGSKWRFSVRDRGPGIPQKYQPHIFQRFSQADGKTTKKTSGTGLGLAIVKSIVELHDGEINFHSTPGEGAEFYFDLYKSTSIKKTLGEVKLAEGLPTALVIEDNQEIADLIRHMLEKNGYSTTIATNSQEVTQAITKTQFSIITLDVLLQDCNGIELMTNLAAQGKITNTPVIVISGADHKALKEKDSNGVAIVDWLAKPLEEGRLKTALGRTKTGSELPKVLYVEDDQDLVDVVTAQFRSIANLVVAQNLKSARICLKDTRFDIVLLDLGLPDGDGRELIHELANDPDPMPIVLFTGQETGDEQLPANVDAVFVKSKKTSQDLMQRLREIIERMASAA